MVDENFIYYIRKAYEPYLNVIPENVKPYMTKTIDKIESSKPGFYWVLGEGVGVCIPVLSLNQTEPKVGDTMEVFGEVGQTIDGMRLNGEVIFWRDATYSNMHWQREREDFEAKDRRHKATFKPDLKGLLPFKIKKDAEELWLDHVRKNSDDGYSFGVVRFAARWAHHIEKLGRSPENFKKAASLADDEGITGMMYGFAVNILSQVWEHGEELRRWHNLDTQMGSEGEKANESGGLLSPAIFAVGAE